MSRLARVDPLERLGDPARVQVRAGIVSAAQLQADLLRMATEDVGGADPAGVAARVLERAYVDPHAEARAWPAVTDHDRLEAAFLLDQAVLAFTEEGLAAHFEEGRVEVAAPWQRRL